MYASANVSLRVIQLHISFIQCTCIVKQDQTCMDKCQKLGRIFKLTLKLTSEGKSDSVHPELPGKLLDIHCSGRINGRLSAFTLFLIRCTFFVHSLVLMLKGE